MFSGCILFPWLDRVIYYHVGSTLDFPSCLQVDDALDLIRWAYNGFQLGLIQNVLYGFLSEGIIEGDTRYARYHASEIGYHPLLSVLWEDPDESKGAFFTCHFGAHFIIM